MKKIDISSIPNDLLNCISGGVGMSKPSGPFEIYNFGLTPGVAVNENVIAGKLQIDLPITPNIAITATTTVTSNYNDISNPSIGLGIIITP